jgi:hypothetical protein
LALFERRPPARMLSIVIAGVRKPAQQATYAVQQKERYWITSSARARRVGGILMPGAFATSISQLISAV